MTATPIETSPLEHRIESLARLTRLLTGMVVLLALLCMVRVAWRLLPPEHHRLVAQGFMLRDAHGLERASLALGSDGAPTLRLNNTKGKARAMMWVKDDGSVNFRLTDPNGVNRAEILLEANGTPHLLLADREGSNRASLELGAEDAPGMVLRAPNGTKLWSAP